MENRPSIEKILLDTAALWSTRSTCKRLQVGAVIAREGRIISTGYNGTLAGSDNCCEEEIYDSFGVEIVSKKETFHAESNAILFAAKEGSPLAGTEIYITHAPCIECSKMIIQSGICTVYFSNYYRDDSGIKFLNANGINVIYLESTKQ